MTEDNGARVSSNVPNDASQTRQRKKRKWDQPAASLVSAGLAVPGAFPLGNAGLLGGITVPGVTPVTVAHLMNPFEASCPTIPQVYQVPLIPQQTATVIQKLIQPKIQDELIAREIVINDAESLVRYKLTKRQTQEEIQRCTGAVVITRGKYRPPNASTDGEKPLYLHISAGANLKETAERILAVDRAAAMVEEMLKQGQNPTMSNGLTAPNTCVYLGFDADPSWNIAARIRGPNDQYINHIMNETGATVSLRGCGSGNLESVNGEEGQLPLHLFLSSNNSKSLEDAKLLAENLLDTISVECGVSRVSSSKVYSAVPPPQQVYSAVPPPHQLLAGVQSSGNEVKTITSLSSPTVGASPAPAVSSVGTPVVATVFSRGAISQPGGLLNSVQSQANIGGYPQPLPLLSNGTSYNGYGGIYSQVTPLQQVALALRQSSPIPSTVAPTTSAPSTEPKLNVNSTSGSEKEKRPPQSQRRKFQELPVGPAKVHQELEMSKPNELLADLGVRNVSTMPAPKKLVQPASNGMPPPLPRTMPPPPPKFTSSAHVLTKTKSDDVPDTLVKLMEYGEDDDDSEETNEELPTSNSGAVTARKPFWAL
ncbi:protein RIK isoform X1 [Prunus yedoensis var. nudiflora]|uniref:Protein RIK n=1 Tax=Prunus yedoensis var. nudiflora TaxID=2094558 RepID=A0A314Z8E8_PRUYE|nr:protein RIK isoform X1 [Prunus yedoensis var. nudiflora]